MGKLSHKSTQSGSTVVVADINPTDGCPVPGMSDELISVQYATQPDHTLCECILQAPESGLNINRFVIEETSQCFCRQLTKIGCLPHIRSVSEDTIRVELYLSNRRHLREVLSELKAYTDSVNVLSITNVPSEASDSDLVHVKVDRLTTKQEEALKVAIEHGYFSDSRSVNMKELASQLDITPSAFAKRLRSAQQQIFTQLY